MQKNNQVKRRALLGLVSLSGATGMLTSWQKPIVSAVVLPAHGETSNLAITCGSATGIEMGNDTDQDLVVLSFEPGDACSLTASQSSGEGFDPTLFDGNIIIAVDAGANPFVNWDTEVLGDDNWSVTPNPGQDNTNSGQLTLMATRLNAPGAGNVYSVTLNLSLSGTDLSDSALVVRAIIRSA